MGFVGGARNRWDNTESMSTQGDPAQVATRVVCKMDGEAHDVHSVPQSNTIRKVEGVANHGLELDDYGAEDGDPQASQESSQGMGSE